MRFPIRSLALAAILGLAACKQQGPDPDALQENAVEGTAVENAIATNVVEAPPPVAGPLNETNMTAPPPEFSDTEQMRDDADATGLTARLPAQEGDTSSNETQPAQ